MVRNLLPHILNTLPESEVGCLLRGKKPLLYLLRDEGNTVLIFMAGAKGIPAEWFLICVFKKVYGDDKNEVVCITLHAAFSLTLAAPTCVITYESLTT
jgi:hypothetical protein